MVYAYIRVSTAEQSGSSQRFEISNWAKKTNVRVNKWVEESVSGTIPAEKRSLGQLLQTLEPDDLIVCTEISRLGRSVLMIMSILNDCSKNQIRLHTIKDNFDLNNDLNSKIIAFAFALAAEIERNLISQRTKEALADKRAAGVILGRPRGSSTKRKAVFDDIKRIDRLMSEGISLVELARQYGIHRNTLSNYLKEKNRTS
ncbi:MAG: recombinase family protein [Alistipes sp.]|nr:recombinase family protein [Candidatus Minthomonas equi]